MTWKPIHPALGLLTNWAECQWKMLAKAKDLHHQLGTLEWPYQATDSVNVMILASPEEA